MLAVMDKKKEDIMWRDSFEDCRIVCGNVVDANKCSADEP
jgi:hypothetical protein